MSDVLEIFLAITDKQNQLANLKVGEAHFTYKKNALSTTFYYETDYIVHENSYAIDPSLPLVHTPLHCKNLPGAFRDSLPDRWGRNLILRQQQVENSVQESFSKGALRQLNDVDFLLGVQDITREGALRFRFSDSKFLASYGNIPPKLQLPELLAAAREVANDSAGKDAIKELLAAGSGSLGGARPKASVCDGGRLLLAKFSHPHDEWDVIALEKTALDLATIAKISASKAKLLHFGKERILLLERFDRANSLIAGPRIGYISGMTVLQSEDGDARDYIELAEAVAELSSQPKEQLAELFRRVVFSVAINNTDDHLRNWGFLRKNGTWVLSPLFDVNPSPYSREERATQIAGVTGEKEVEALNDLAMYCGVNADDRNKIIDNVVAAMSTFEKLARKNKVPKRDIEIINQIILHKCQKLKQLKN